MAKATHTLIESSRLFNRRSVLARGVVVAAATAVAGAQSAVAAMPLRGEPTGFGRELLRLIAALQTYSGPDGGTEPLSAAIDSIEATILARPIMTLPDVIDRLVLAAHWSDPRFEIEPDRLEPILGSLLAIAGIRVGQCYPNPELADERGASSDEVTCPAASGLDG